MVAEAAALWQESGGPIPGAVSDAMPCDRVEATR
jgi:hypothetical protein